MIVLVDKIDIRIFAYLIERTMTKTIIIETFKKTWFYKFIKTSEAVFVGGGLALGIFLGWFAVLPALVILAGYIALNAAGLANSEPYVVRDVIKEEIDERLNPTTETEIVKEDIDNRFNDENGVTYK